MCPTALHRARVIASILVFTLCGCTGRPVEGEERPRTLLKWGSGPEKKPEPEDEPKKPDPIATDRPDFTEASSTVGIGRVQLEGGYTYYGDRGGDARTASHSYPEALLRVGMLADWFEFRIAQNINSIRGTEPSNTFSAGGADDTYLGVKLFIAEQKGVLPETSLVIQTQVPTGHPDLTSGAALPGFNLLYGWEVAKKLTVAGSSQANRAIDDDSHGYLEMAQSLTVGYSYTEKLGSYTEWFAFFPAGATAPGVTAQHYMNGGFTYKVTPNFQLDIRAGLGLSRSANDFFAGTGFGIRY